MQGDSIGVCYRLLRRIVGVETIAHLLCKARTQQCRFSALGLGFRVSGFCV